jgi:hypothetical protein
MGVSVQMFGTEPSSIWVSDNPGCIYGDRGDSIRAEGGRVTSKSKQVLEVDVVFIYTFLIVREKSVLPNARCSPNAKPIKAAAHVDPRLFTGWLLARLKKYPTS